jgi:putative endonuclease
MPLRLPFARLCRWVVRRNDRLLRTAVPLVDDAGGKWDKDRVGRFGEEVAGRWLWLVGGCRVLYRNFRARDGGELDIVARDGETLAFVEVKTRTSVAFGRPALAVDAEKQALIIRGAREWMSMLGWPEIYFRFDIVEVVLRDGEAPAVTWVRGAFSLPDHLRW